MRTPLCLFVLALGAGLSGQVSTPSVEVTPAVPVAAGADASPSPVQARLPQVSLQRLIQIAYRVQENQVAGLTDWMREERFDVLGTWLRPGSAAASPAALQSLLQERFKLRTRREVREGDTFILERARDDGRLGPNIRASTVDCAAVLAKRKGRAPAFGGATGDALPTCDAVSIEGPSEHRILANGRPMTMFAAMLTSRIGRRVEDRTGLDGLYDLDLRWGAEVPAIEPGAPAEARIDGAPPLATALREQLGLRLGNARGPMQMIVIEHAERPTPD